MMYLINKSFNHIETGLLNTVKECDLKYSNKWLTASAVSRVSVYRLQKLY